MCLYLVLMLPISIGTALLSSRDQSGFNTAVLVGALCGALFVLMLVGSFGRFLSSAIYAREYAWSKEFYDQLKRRPKLNYFLKASGIATILAVAGWLLGWIIGFIAFSDQLLSWYIFIVGSAYTIAALGVIPAIAGIFQAKNEINAEADRKRLTKSQ